MVSIFDEQSTQQARELALGQEATVKPPTGFTENVVSSWQDFRLNNTTGSRDMRIKDAYAERAKILETLTSEKFDNPYDLAPEYAYAVDGQDEAERLAKYEQRVDAVRNRLPPEERAKITSRLSIEDMIDKESQAAEREQQDVASRATIGGVAGSIVGSAGASMTEPLNILTLPVGAPLRAGLLSRIAIEAGLAAGTETLLQPGVQGMRDELGLESGIGQAAENVGMAAAGAGALTAGIAGVGGALGLILKSGAPGLERALKRPLSADEKALVDAVVHDVENDRITPYQEKTAAAAAVKAQNDQLGFDAVVEGRPLADGDLVPAEKFTRKMMDADRTTLEILRGPDLDKIGVDAKLMQFKTGGDEQGVTDRLRGVTEWNVERAGVSLVYEFADGKRIIADGHQRLGLARRLASEGKDVELPTIVLRESDGVTPEMARARAAFKNIAEGTGSSSDAAKVLRDMGATPAEMGLPPKSALVRDAEGLVNLEDDVFGMVINKVISEQNGAIIGRLVQDPRLQPSIAKLIAKLQPANATEADSIVRQALEAGSTTEKQIGLFGEEEISESLYLERARVLDRGLKMMRRNIDTFRTLNERSDAITAEGNTLNVDANTRRLETERTLSQYITAQAHRKGPIGDALSKAARQAKETGQYAPAAREFVETLAAAAQRGAINGDDVRRSGANSEPEYEGSQAQGTIEESAVEQIDDATLDMFGDPTGPASEDQALNIAKEITDQAAETRVSETQPRGVFRDDLMKADGSVSLVEAGDTAKRLVSEALAAGREVNYYIEGKPRKILSVSNLGLVDKNGNPWGVAPILQPLPGDDVRIEFGPVSKDRQPLMDGFTAVTDADRLAIAATRPLKGGNEPLDFGMFGNEKDQMDIMDFAVPIGEKIDAEGKRSAQTQTVRDIMADLEDDQEFIETLAMCDRPRNAA